MKTEKMNEEERRSSSFFNGLTLGTFVGAVGFFLFGTKKGRKVKEKLFKKGKNFWEEAQKALNEAQADIDKKTKQAKRKAEKKIKETSTGVKAVVDKGKEAVIKTKIGGRFFQKGGKSLGK